MQDGTLTIKSSRLDFHDGVAVEEASTLGLRPGEWPDRVVVIETDGHAKAFGRQGFDGNAMRYALRNAWGAAILTVAILND
jgi:hypothetical protein